MSNYDDHVYEAERAMHVQGYSERLSDPQAFLDYVVGTRWFQHRWPKRKLQVIEVRDSTRTVSAWADISLNVIYLPPWACNTLTLLHELAHVATGKLDHGPGFAAAHLSLVRRFMGAEAGQRYRHALLAFGVVIR
jgi:putative metallohydrolase (TIGR04338 family)